MSAPIDTPILLLFPILPLTRSLWRNDIGAEGATALAAILKETMITQLKCAATPGCSLSCQRPLTRTLSPFPILPLTRSLNYNDIGEKGATALGAILNETKITTLGCATT